MRLSQAKMDCTTAACGLRRGGVWYAADHLATATLEKVAGVQRANLLAEMTFEFEMTASHVTTLPKADWQVVRLVLR